jgi:hypothetical protein
MRYRLIPIALLLPLLLPTAAIAQWKREGTTVWRQGLSPGQQITVGYGGLVKSRSVKADKCDVVRVPGKKSPETNVIYVADGPIVIGNTTYSGSQIDTNPGNYVYRCKRDIQGDYKPYFASPTDSLPWHHWGTSGEADLKGNLYFPVSGPGAYNVEYRTFGRRKVKANACGIAKLTSSGSYNHGQVGLTIDDDTLNQIPAQVMPKCKNGAIVP